MRIRPVLVVAVAHFALWLASAAIARGWDVDQISSRSTVSQFAETVNGVLSFPHDPLLHGLLSHFRWSETVVVVAMVVSSLAWGLALCAVWNLLRTRRLPQVAPRNRRRQHASSSGLSVTGRPEADDS